MIGHDVPIPGYVHPSLESLSPLVMNVNSASVYALEPKSDVEIVLVREKFRWATSTLGPISATDVTPYSEITGWWIWRAWRDEEGRWIADKEAKWISVTHQF